MQFRVVELQVRIFLVRPEVERSQDVEYERCTFLGSVTQPGKLKRQGRLQQVYHNPCEVNVHDHDDVKLAEQSQLLDAPA